MDATPSIVASLYPGHRIAGAQERYIQTATLEPRLEQLGQNPPVTNVARRWYEHGVEHVHDDSLMRLTVADARELVTALGYLIERAERG